MGQTKWRECRGETTLQVEEPSYCLWSGTIFDFPEQHKKRRTQRKTSASSTSSLTCCFTSHLSQLRHWWFILCHRCVRSSSCGSLDRGSMYRILTLKHK
ncbi:unnamed protein product [Lactuca saligna]|uniref:Uncharacterized protein n=1 Tax=Lactuca saligna TaxID=75948 RepID=A0AA35V7W6_LACSI|nr:unnamed protein product [Lactuca saligna]